MLLSGLTLLIKPEIIFSFIENNMEKTTLYVFAIVVRFILGIIFLVTAKETKYPNVIKFLGYLFIIASILLIFMGQVRFQHFITYIFPHVNPFILAVGVLAIAFGAFLIYAFSRKNELKQN